LAWRNLYERFGVAEVMNGLDSVALGGYRLVIEEQIPPTLASEVSDGNSNHLRRARGTIDLDRRSSRATLQNSGPITLRLNGSEVIDAEVQIYLPEQSVLDFICTDRVTIDRLLEPLP
jgi:hypothetical protein